MTDSITNSIAGLVEDIAASMARVDATRPVGPARRFLPGIGPLTEGELTAALLKDLATAQPKIYGGGGPRGYPTKRATCDVVIPERWAIEIKLARPYGDNGKPAERWSENLLYPYPGNTSAIGDCLKLAHSGFLERKAVVVVGYEHSPPKILLEPAVRGFELLATEVCKIQLGPRTQGLIEGLVHPHHQQARVYGWEVLGVGSTSD